MARARRDPLELPFVHSCQYMFEVFVQLHEVADAPNPAHTIIVDVAQRPTRGRQFGSGLGPHLDSPPHAMT